MPLDDAFWEEQDKKTEDALIALYILLLLYGVSGGLSVVNNPTIDPDKVTQAIQSQVNKYRADIAGINATTRTRTDKIIEEWKKTGTDIFTLSAMLLPVFAEQRLEFIGVTEVTKAINDGNVIAWQNSDVRDMQWQTSEDGRVCPECAARNGIIYPADSKNAPPLHPGCRCWLQPAKE